MKKIYLILSLLILAGCYQTGYQPHYIISQEEIEGFPQEQI